MKKRRISRRDFIEKTSALAAAGLLLPACDDGGGQPDGGTDGDVEPDGDHDVLPDGDTDGDSDEDTFPPEPYDDRRVVRVYDRRVTSYGFGESEACWERIDADVLQQMLEGALIELARAESVEEAWQRLLPGDLSTARIAVKANWNGDQPHFINTSPAMVVALGRSLVAAGASPGSITFFDRSRGVPAGYADAIRTELPDIVLLGGGNVTAHETETISAPSMVLEDESVVTVPVPVCLVEADHLINLHLMKGHFGGATGSMKNLFGLARDVWGTFHGNRDLGLTRYERGHQCADLATQPIIREKMRLLVSEGIYATWWHANKPPDRLCNEDLFPGGLPCSVTVSRNPLYQDTVLYDLLKHERDVAIAQECLTDGYDSYPDDWLRFCSEAPYEIGVFERGELVEGTFTPSDLSYDQIDYRSFTTGA